ncbi:hypothetical protein D7X94_06995 [Acutalibacter sp. 1XD8-33]|nr:hypothetical protein D7X94_06995 [Acutalibacter sp. 1XD8-33]
MRRLRFRGSVKKIDTRAAQSGQNESSYLHELFATGDFPRPLTAQCVWLYRTQPARVKVFDQTFFKKFARCGAELHDLCRSRALCGGGLLPHKNSSIYKSKARALALKQISNLLHSSL